MTIQSVSIENLKRFRSLTLPMRAITVLTGANGGGKTTVIDALLLARQASSGAPPPERVQLNGPFGLQLGEAQDVLHRAADPADGIGVAVAGDDGAVHAWRFAVPDERSLNLPVAERPARPPDALAREGRRFAYLAAERLGPRDVLGASSVARDDLNVGCQGEFTAQVLAELERAPVSARRLHPDTEPRSARVGSATTLRQQVEAWTSSIVRPIALDAEWILDSGVTLIRFRSPGALAERMRPTNMGFGVSYALPVITAGLLAPAGSLLVVENPEAHLHPSGQSAMGHFLARVASDGVQLVVETHSDHVINGIRRAVGIDRILGPANAVVHFFRADDDAPGADPIDVTQTGDLIAWPPGFFDQMDVDLAALSKARRHRTS
jgi:predicted ATPase